MRSLLVIGSIALGLWAGAFVIAFAWGLYQNNIYDVIHRQFSHVQVHHAQFGPDMDPHSLLRENDTWTIAAEAPGVRSATTRLVVSGMISSPTMATGMKLFGIRPMEEALQTELNQVLMEGSYFPSNRKDQLYIGEKLARKLRVKLNGKVVVTFSDTSNNITAAALRVTGIYRSRNASLDERIIYTEHGTLATLLGVDGCSFHEAALLLDDSASLAPNVARLAAAYPAALVQTWKQLSPETDMIISSFDLYMYIVVGIILLALTFGIVNTMLMAVLERVREIGVLKSVGMNNRRIFSMIMLETLFLSLLGSPLGIVLAWFTIWWTGTVGIDLGMFSAGMSQFGFSAIVYPALEPSKYINIAVMSLVTALLASAYPAWRALQLKPVEAVRKI